MNYQIKIIKTEPNKNYKDELANYKEKTRWGNGMNEAYPTTEIIKDVLICELTEEQYKKVKAEVYKVFE